MISNHNAENLIAASNYLRVLEKIRPTDEESRETQLISSGPNMQWRLPYQFYGDKDVEFEDVEVESIQKVINTASPIRVFDAEWLQKLVKNGDLSATNKVTS